MFVELEELEGVYQELLNSGCIDGHQITSVLGATGLSLVPVKLVVYRELVAHFSHQLQILITRQCGWTSAELVTLHS